MELRERSYLLDELGDPDAPIGSRSWSLWLANEIRKTLYDNQQTGTRLRYLVDTFKEHTAWQELGFLTWEDFCAKKLKTEAEKIEKEVKLWEHGGDRRSKEFQDGNHVLKSADYNMRRLERDHPELAQRVRLGELSPFAAANQAGFRKRRFQLPDEPQAAARYLAKRVDKEWVLCLVDELMRLT